MRQPTYQEVSDRMLDLGMTVFDSQPYDLTLFGIRSRVRERGGVDWRDLIGVLFRDDVDRVHCLSWEGTTDPGARWLENPMRDEGCAILAADVQHRGLWTIGMHRGRYVALVQDSPALVYRDNDLDLVAETPGEPSAEMIGINLHRAGEYTVSESVDSWSAGCQVIRCPWDFATLMWLAQAQKNAGLGDTYSYVLLMEWREDV